MGRASPRRCGSKVIQREVRRRRCGHPGLRPLIMPTCELYPAQARIISQQRWSPRTRVDRGCFGRDGRCDDAARTLLVLGLQHALTRCFSFVSVLIQVIVGIGAAGRPQNTRHQRFFRAWNFVAVFASGPIFERLRAPLMRLELFLDLS